MMGGVHSGHAPAQGPGRFVASAVIVLVLAVVAVAHRGYDPTAPEPAHARAAPVVFGDTPNFRAIPDPDARKQRFFGYLTPAAARVNIEVSDRRERLLSIARAHQQGELSRADRDWLSKMAQRYRVEATDTGERIAALERRIDVVPGALVIAQAAIESGWGTSRFAREGNNLFGEWCFEEGCGMVPRSRSAGASHEVRWFPSMLHSIRSYFRNLNSHPAYADLRARRAQARASGSKPNALELAGGLKKYSERGTAYVEEVRTVIRANDLDQVYAAAARGD